MSIRRLVALPAIALALNLAGSLPAAAQFGGAAPYTPAPGSRELKDVLYNWTWHMGMLRGQAEPELVGTLELQAHGAIRVGGEQCELTKYRISANYQLPGYRTQIDCVLPGGATHSNIETINGRYVWDEDIPGAEIIAGEGTATPRPGALEERLIRLWASPHGAPKAAIAAAADLPLADSFGHNPATLLDERAAAGVRSRTTLEWSGDNAILTFPVPGVEGAMATATLGSDFLPQSVVVTHGDNTTEFLYGDFADFNNPLHRIEALYAGTIVERFNGEVVRRLETELTEIGQVYVAIPVPASIRAAGPAAVQGER